MGRDYRMKKWQRQKKLETNMKCKFDWSVLPGVPCSGVGNWRLLGAWDSDYVNRVSWAFDEEKAEINAFSFLKDFLSLVQCFIEIVEKKNTKDIGWAQGLSSLWTTVNETSGANGINHNGSFCKVAAVLNWTCIFKEGVILPYVTHGLSEVATTDEVSTIIVSCGVAFSVRCFPKESFD